MSQNNLHVCRTFRRIDAAIHALRGKEVHWNRQGLPCEVIRGAGGAFKRQEIPTVFPHWAYKFVSWVRNITNGNTTAQT